MRKLARTRAPMRRAEGRGRHGEGVTYMTERLLRTGEGRLGRRGRHGAASPRSDPAAARKPQGSLKRVKSLDLSRQAPGVHGHIRCARACWPPAPRAAPLKQQPQPRRESAPLPLSRGPRRVRPRHFPDPRGFGAPAAQDAANWRQQADLGARPRFNLRAGRAPQPASLQLRGASKFANIEELDASGNRISALDAEVASLRHLRVLRLGDNQVRAARAVAVHFPAPDERGLTDPSLSVPAPGFGRGERARGAPVAVGAGGGGQPLLLAAARARLHCARPSNAAGPRRRRCHDRRAGAGPAPLPRRRRAPGRRSHRTRRRPAPEAAMGPVVERPVPADGLRSAPAPHRPRRRRRVREWTCSGPVRRRTAPARAAHVRACPSSPSESAGRRRRCVSPQC